MIKQNKLLIGMIFLIGMMSLNFVSSSAFGYNSWTKLDLTDNRTVTYNTTSVYINQTGASGEVCYANGTSCPIGFNGTDGTDGTNGINGLNGLNGLNGTNGTNGINGLNGTNGSTGATGTTGATGSQGIAGTNGTNGLNGLNGTNGTNGANGLNGTNGIDGTNGTNGLNGTNGTNGLNGLNGTNGIDGVNGTFQGVLNTTQFNDNGTQWDIDQSWLSNFIDAVVGFVSGFIPNTNNGYLYNDTTQIYFNETKLNLTIDARASGGNTSFNQTLTDSLYEPKSTSGSTVFKFEGSKFKIKVT